MLECYYSFFLYKNATIVRYTTRLLHSTYFILIYDDICSIIVVFITIQNTCTSIFHDFFFSLIFHDLKVETLLN
jgi:hypothetical protein